MMGILATAAADPQISGNWIFAMLGVISTALTGWWAHQRGMKKARVVIEDQPVDVRTHKARTPPSYDQFRGLMERQERTDARLERLERDVANQFKQLLESAAAREYRIIEVINEGLSKVHQRMDQFLNRKP
jgi:hypothetical protein